MPPIELLEGLVTAFGGFERPDGKDPSTVLTTKGECDAWPPVASFWSHFWPMEVVAGGFGGSWRAFPSRRAGERGRRPDWSARLVVSEGARGQDLGQLDDAGSLGEGTKGG